MDDKFLRALEPIAIKSSSLAEIIVKCAAEGHQLVVNKQVCDLLFDISVGRYYNYENEEPEYLNSLKEDFLAVSCITSDVFEQALCMADVCSEGYIEKILDFIANPFNVPPQKRSIYQLSFRSIRFKNIDTVAAWMIDHVCKVDSNAVLKGQNKLQLLLRNLNITRSMISLADGFYSTFSKSISLSEELYDMYVLKLQNCVETIKALIEHGADPNTKEKGQEFSFNDIVKVDDIFTKKFDEDYKLNLLKYDL